MKLENILKGGKFPQYCAEEIDYIDELKFCLETGPISDAERRMLVRTRDKLKISEARAAELEKETIENVK